MAGVFFTLMGVIFLFDQLDILHLDLTLVLPIVLIALGVVVVLGSRRSGQPPGGVPLGTVPPRVDSEPEPSPLPAESESPDATAAQTRPPPWPDLFDR
jgi:hypothetical protein